jgi:hypothetical protein
MVMAVGVITSRMRVWVAADPIWLLAVRYRVIGPVGLPGGGVPLRSTDPPEPNCTKFNHPGATPAVPPVTDIPGPFNAPATDPSGFFGKPLVVIVKVLLTPTVKSTDAGLVKAAPSYTLSENCWAAEPLTDATLRASG